MDEPAGELRPLGFARAARPSLPPPIPNYELIKRIGQGSYGEVWLARTVIGEYRAVKIVYLQAFEEALPYEREFEGIRKFEPISRSHPGLVNVLHIGRDEGAGVFWYVMELADDGSAPPAGASSEPDLRQRQIEAAAVPGVAFDPLKYVPRTLRLDLQRRGRLPFQECLRLGLSLTDALGHIHARGLVHRDIKPSNIIFVQGQPKLADIGLVAAAGERRSLVGTEGFVAPEGAGTPQADLYSLGKLLYEICTGKTSQRFPEPPTDLADFPELEGLRELNEIILKACNSDPAARYASAEAMHKDLALLQSGRSLYRLRLIETRLQRLRKVVAAVLVTVLLVGSGYLYQQRQAKHFRALADESRKNLVRLHLSNGLRQMEAGNLIDSLPWFVEGLRLDQGHPQLEEMHRRRIEAILAQCPRLLAMGTHEGPINHAALSPNARRVVTASSDGTARVWDAQTGEMLTPPLRHRAAVTYAAFSPDGNRILTASEDRTARVWDAATGLEELPPMEHSAGINLAKFSPDGGTIVTCSIDGIGKLWNTAHGHLLRASFKHDDLIGTLAFSRTNERFITGSADQTARVWSLATGALLTPPLVHEGRVRTVAFSPDGDRVATGCTEDAARIWSLPSGKPVTPLLKHLGAVWHVEFSEDGSTLVSAGGKFKQSGDIRVWNATTGEPVRDPILHTEPFRCAQVSPDGHWLATGSDETVRIYDLVTGRVAAGPFSHTDSVWTVAFGPNGRRLLTASKDGTWRLWDLAAPVFLAPPLENRGEAQRAEFTPDGNQIFTARGSSVWVYDSNLLQVRRRISTGSSGADFVCGSPDGRYISAAGPNPPWVCTLDTGKNVLTGAARWDYAANTAFSRDSKRVLLACSSSNVVVYRLDETTAEPLRLHTASPARFAAFSPDGKWIASGCGDNDGRWGEARIWNALTGEPASPPLPHEGAVSCVAFTPDSRFVVTANANAAVQSLAARLWKVPSGEDTGIRFLHADGVTWVAVSPDGKQVATASEDSTARVWDLATGNPASPPLRHHRGVQSIRFSPDSRRVVTASNDRTARVWEVDTGTP